MKVKRLVLLTSLIFCVLSCLDNDEVSELEPLSEYQWDVINYFREIALGYEFGGEEITNKWNSNMRIFVAGNPNARLLNKLESVKNRINQLATDGFSIEIVNDSLQSNCYLFFGKNEDYAKIFPDLEDVLSTNLGLFSVRARNSEIYDARIFVNTEETKLEIDDQESILLEEVTQSLGLGKDSPRYTNSIFYEENYRNSTENTEYSMIDEELVRLLYHPRMKAGLNFNQTTTVISAIFRNE